MICLAHRTPSAALDALISRAGRSGAFIWYGFTVGQWFVGVMRRTKP